MFSLESPEIEEIAQLYGELSPRHICVIDKEERVVDAVRKVSEKYKQVVPITGCVLDINYVPFNEEGDIVIAFNIISRTINPIKSLEHIAYSTRVGGLLVSNIPTPNGFIKIGDSIYQRVH